MGPGPQSLAEAISPWQPNLFSLGVFTFIVLGLLGVILFLTRWLGTRNETREKLRPYESGVIPTGSARFNYPVPFYLVATFFLIFDVEAAFIFSWAVAIERLSWSGWLHITFFIFILLMSLFYIWIKGGLEWGPSARKY